MSELQAGRPLDASVNRALKLGVAWSTCNECHTVHHGAVERCEDCGEDVSYHEPPYSTDISAAWAVVERMHRDWTFRLENSEDTRGLWFCAFGAVGRATAETAALAICLAALAAVADRPAGREDGA